MKTALKKHFATAEAIARLLHPYAEVLIHNVKQNKIAVIYNNFSKRKAGNGSLLDNEEILTQPIEVWGPYEKINWDGKRLKSITSAIRDDDGKLIGLLCINLDLSVLEKYQLLIESFIGSIKTSKQPEVLFKDDWRERVNQSIHHYLKKHQLNLNTLTAAQKQQIIHHLYAQGAFDGKNTANYIAQVLGISRATVYNYLQKKSKG